MKEGTVKMVQLKGGGGLYTDSRRRFSYSFASWGAGSKSYMF
ncbi:hypothetical protein [Enterocloster sp.]